MKTIAFICCGILLSSCTPKTSGGLIARVLQETEKAVAPLKADTAGSWLAEAAQKMSHASPDDEVANPVNAEAVFIEKLLYALRQPGSFESDFRMLEPFDIQVLKADDGQFRMFYWLSPYSGTMWHVQHIIQYKDGDNLVAIPFNSLYAQPEDEGAPTPFFEHVYALKGTGQKTYLLTGYGQMSGMSPYAVCHTLAWNGKTFLMDAKRIFKEDGLWRAGLYAEANLQDDRLAARTKASLHISFDPQTGILTYPEAKITEAGALFTGRIRSLTYRDGVFR